MTAVRYILLVFLLIVVLIFGIQNAENAQINFLVFDAHMSKALVIFLSFALGSAITVLFSIPAYFRKRKMKSEYETKIKILENDLVKKNDELRVVNENLIKAKANIQ